MVYTDIFENNTNDDTKAPLPFCFFLIPKLKTGEILTTGQYVTNEIFSNLQYRPLFKNSVPSIHIDLRDTSGEKTLFVSVGITHLVLMFKKASSCHL